MQSQRFHMTEIFGQQFVLEKVKVPIFLQHDLLQKNLIPSVGKNKNSNDFIPVISFEKTFQLCDQQIYNIMQPESIANRTTSIAQAALEYLVAKAENQIKLNSFAARNQPSFILSNQAQIINTNLNHFYNQPTRSPAKGDQQPSFIEEDSMMNVGIIKETTGVRLASEHASNKTKSERPSLKATRYVQNNHKSFNQKTREQILDKFKQLYKQQTEKQDSYVQVLRTHKIQEEIKKLSEKKETRPKASCKLMKGEQILFDYDGNFSKRKQLAAKYFNNSLISGDATNSLNTSKNMTKGANSQRVNDIKQAVLIRSGADKSQRNNIVTSQFGQKIVNFDKSNKKEDILRCLQIKEPGIKVTVDGEAAKIDKSIMEKNAERSKSRITEKSKTFKTIQMRKISNSLNQRFKTETVEIKQDKIEVPTKINSVKRHKIRSGTEESDYPQSSTDKISVQNFFLHKQVVDNMDPDGNYIELPSHRSARRRVKTNLQNSSVKQNSDLESLHIKERLMSLTKDGDRLPRILLQHKQAEIQILREIRKKKYIF